MKPAALALRAAALCLLAVPPAAQVGRPLPDDPELDDFAQTGASSLEDLVGRAVLIEFFADWCPSSREEVGHLNGLQERFGARGLSVVGVTASGRSSTERFVEESGLSYGYAFDRSGAMQRSLGVETYPTAVLVDPAGTVVWRGHPSSLDEALLEESLDGAFGSPVWEWPASARSAIRALKKRQYGKAVRELRELDDPDVAPYEGEVLALVARQVRHFADARAEGDYLGAVRLGERLLDELEGLADESERVRTSLEAIEDDPEARRVIRLQERLEKLRTTRLDSDRDVERLIDRVEDLRQDAEETYAAVQAQAFLRELRARLR